MHKSLLFLNLAIFIAFQVVSQDQKTERLKIKNFKLKNVTDNQLVELQDYLNNSLVVVIFISHHCPYAKLYTDRIERYVDTYSTENVQFLLVNSTDPALDNENSIVKLRMKIKDNNWSMPYLADKRQEVKKLLNAKKTPEAFVFKPEEEYFRLIYRGALDDNPSMVQNVERDFLGEAIQTGLKSNEPVYTFHKPVGCAIKTL